MIKYLLIVQICSVIMQQCTEPLEMYPLYNSHYDCATGGFIRGITAIREIGPEEVNSKHILINFKCEKQESL